MGLACDPCVLLVSQARFGYFEIKVTKISYPRDHQPVIHRPKLSSNCVCFTVLGPNLWAGHPSLWELHDIFSYGRQTGTCAAAFQFKCVTGAFLSMQTP